MSANVTVALASVFAALVVGWAVPAVAMRMLVPTLSASPAKVRNYRGAEVSTGLGTVWLVWGMLVTVWGFVSLILGNMGIVPGSAVLISGFAWMVPGLLVLIAFAFGLVDDVFGGPSAKGFRGHLSAMLEGRLTTGGLKVVGIGLAAALAAVFGRLRSAPLEGAFDPVWIASWVLATVSIALAANLVNLTDLRPGRALKTYCVLVAASVPSLVVGVTLWQGAAEPAEAWSTVAVSLVLALGPAVAVWRYDLGERGMLGDAGANAMGALAGYLIVVNLPVWGLAIAAGVLLVLNLASERVSFSDVIEGNRFLRRFDALGRLPLEKGQGSERAAQADGNAYDEDTGTGKDGA